MITANISETLQQCIKTLQLFDDSTDDYLYMYDLTLERVFLTDKIREKYPIPPAGNKGNDFSDWDDIVYPKDRKLMNHYRDLLLSGQINAFDIDYRIMDRNGNKVWVRVKGKIREQEGTKNKLIVGRISEIGSGTKVDTLTGLGSTGKFLEDFKESLKEHNGYLMILGVDNFRNVNITKGREYGDFILIQISDILDKNTAYPVEIYRLSGDCFAVNFIRKNKQEVENFYNNIKNLIKNMCTVSAGVVNYESSDYTEKESIYLYAETALNQAKKEGKNKLVFFSEDDCKKRSEQIELFVEIKEAIQDGYRGFHLEYQPQISCQDHKICGVEALLRYDSPTRGRISPMEFIPLLEQTNLICPVGEWVLKTAVAQCKEWRKDLPNLRMSVNISYIQLKQEGITQMVLDVLHERNLPGDALTLELTENIQLQNYNYFNKIFYIWKANGIRISIDDFGTGYSSLSYLKSIEINEVKIDRCFVSHVQYNAYNFRLLSNMIELAHSVQIDVCCEGVETVEELIALQELKADILQGYFFAKPYTAKAFELAYICSESEEFAAREEKEQTAWTIQSEERKAFIEEYRKEEIGNVVESMDEIVYVSDIDTYELYYLNAVGRQLTGVYDYKGCKCYEVLQGKDKPCHFCSNDCLCQDKFWVWEMENKFLKRYFLLKDKLIYWKGKLSRVEIAFDITEKETLSQSMQRKLALKQIMLDIFNLFTRTPQLSQKIPDVLKLIGEFCKCDRAYIATGNNEDGTYDVEYEWGLKQMQKNDCPQITVPIQCFNQTYGYIGIDNPQQDQEAKDLLETSAQLIGYCMEKEEMQQRLQLMQK